MPDELWIKKVENPTLKTLNDWRNELYGYYMVVTDSTNIDGVEMVVARYYGTDKDKINDICDELYENAQNSYSHVFYNIKNNWMGGAFLVKTDS